MSAPSSSPTDDLASQYRSIYVSQFKAAVGEGKKIPFLLHLSLLGFHIIPALYLAIPHKRRPWLYRARWLVLALTTTWHVWMVRNMSSANFALAYGVGLVAGWGILWNFTLLVWTRPQWDAKRVERFPNPRFRKSHAQEPPVSPRIATTGNVDDKTSGKSLVDWELVDGPNGTNGDANGRRLITSTSRAHTNGHANGHATNGHAKVGLRERHRQEDGNLTCWQNGGRAGDPVAFGKVVEEEGCRPGPTGPDTQTGDMESTNRFIYEWQDYPEDAPLLTRLDWAFDIATTLRFAGWNWAITVLPPYHPPPYADEEKTRQLPLESLGNANPRGCRRSRSRRELLWDRVVLSLVPAYILMDVCGVYLPQDPYFVLGPNELPLPPRLASLPPLVLFLGRNFAAFAVLVVGLRAAWDVGALLLAFVSFPVLGFRADPWNLPTMCGPFAQVLDRGLAGFWGYYWHQTFRFGFAAPTRWLLRRGCLRRDSAWAGLVGAVVAFVQSGFLHAMASLTSMPRSRPWEPAIFFLLAGIGTQLQSVLSRVFRRRIEQMPSWLRRATNLAVMTFWFQLTCRFILDDFTRCGLFLWEPVPFSIMRWLGFGAVGDHWWRWGGDFFPWWYTGKHFWDTGIGI